MRNLAAGKTGVDPKDRKYAKYVKALQKKFVFLNVYCTSVQAEHDPRGPEGPYRFQERSVPVFLVKRWDGETLVKQFGFTPDPSQGTRRLASLVDKAVKANGPIAPPKALRPLLKSWAKAGEHLKRKRTAPAIAELLKIVKGGAYKKKFAEGPPPVAADAAAKLAELEKHAESKLEEAAKRTDVAEARKAYGIVLRQYGKIRAIKKKAKAAIAALPKE